MDSLSLASLAGKQIFVYGAGGVGIDILNLLQSCHISEGIRFVVSEVPEGGTELDGYQLLGLKEAWALLDGSVVIIATMPGTVEDIRQLLQGADADAIYTAEEIRDVLYQELYEDIIEPYKLVLSNFLDKIFK